jgi:predicted helicase
MFGAVSLENVARIKRQNSKTISVIIGNPPYNANQMNENDNNKNREYFFDYKKKIGGVDGRIKDTYVKASTAQKTKQYDMYKRFIRWASDRISENGIICFICNRSFIDKRQDNGFRKIVEQEFDFIYILDLGGNLHGEGAEAADNVFGITIGVAMVWLGKKSVKTKLDKARIFYHRFPTAPNKSVKLEMIQQTRFESVDFERIAPDEKGNWLNEGIQDDFDSLIPLCSRETKLKGTGNTIFRLYSNGVSTNRDDWVYDFSKENLIKKMKFFFDQYNSEVDRWIDWKAENNYIDIKAESNPVVDDFLHARNLIKWSGRIKRDKLRKHKKGSFDESDIVRGLYRPFTQMFLYYGYIPIDLKGEFKTIFPNNLCIVFNNGMLQSFNALAVDLITDLHFNGDSVCLPLYCYEDSQQVENITDWALRLFRENYADGVGCINAVSCTKNIEDSKVYDASLMHPTQVVIEKLDIFHYVYAVLHDPNYRQKYAQNLKRDFPRIPLYDDFWTWANWGKQLMELHLNYEHAPRYEFTRIDRPLKNPAAKPKVKLKADKLAGKIEVDEITTLSDIPAQAWQYQLGNRSALEWILDQYREKKIADPTLAEKFDNYPFADYKEQAIELLEKVCTVSVKTVEIIEEMPN